MAELKSMKTLSKGRKGRLQERTKTRWKMRVPEAGERTLQILQSDDIYHRIMAQGGGGGFGALSEDNRNAKFAARPSVKSQFFSRLINRVSKSRISRPANQHKPPSNFFPNAVKGKYAYRMKTHRTWSSSQRIAGRKAGKTRCMLYARVGLDVRVE